MRSGMRVAVVVPAFREERLIVRTATTIPAWVDDIYVVDDASDDSTADRVRALHDPRIRLLQHPSNRGVGRAIVTGYHAATRGGADVVAVMAGDGQMDPSDLADLLAPITRQDADYCKGNRFTHADARRMPWARRLAGRGLSWATRVATDLEVDDTQCGYTAISSSAVRLLPLEVLWPRYGYPNDLLAMLAENGLRVTEVPVRPVYAGEDSGVRPWHALVIVGLLASAFARRHFKTRRLQAKPPQPSAVGSVASGAAVANAAASVGASKADWQK